MSDAPPAAEASNDPSSSDSDSNDPAASPAPGRRLGRSAGVTVIGAFGGIAAGLGLDVAIAATFGAGPATDALFVAMRLPIGITAVIMAGANQSLVPMFSRWQLLKSPREFSRSVSIVLTATLLVGSGLAAVGALFARPLMAVTAPGLSDAGLAEATSLARVLFWLIPLVAGAEVLRGYMNARHRFGVPAAMNVVMNGLAALIVIGFSHHRIEVAADAYLIGAAVQFAFMVTMATIAGLMIKPVLALRDADLIAVTKVSGRPLAGAGLNPIARIIEQVFISFLPAGSITILNYANRLVSALGGTVLFRSVMVVLLPRLTVAWENDNKPEVRRLVKTGTALMLRLSIALTVVIAILGRPGAVVVFHRGHFSRADALVLGITLAVYASSLIGQAVQRSLLAPFFAQLSMGPPFRNTIYGVLANLVLLPPLVLPFRHHPTAALVGVAIAFSASQYVNVAHAWWHLRRLVGPIDLGDLAPQLFGMTVAAAASSGVMLGGYHLLRLGHAWGRWELLLRTSAVGAAGLAVFIVLQFVIARPEKLGPKQQTLTQGDPDPAVEPEPASV